MLFPLSSPQLTGRFVGRLLMLDMANISSQQIGEAPTLLSPGNGNTSMPHDDRLELRMKHGDCWNDWWPSEMSGDEATVTKSAVVVELHQGIVSATPLSWVTLRFSALVTVT